MLNIVHALLLLFPLAFLFCMLMLVRNELVYKARTHLLCLAFRKDSHGHYSPTIFDSVNYKLLDKYAYGDMMWMFNKWTFKQFYPEAED